eukprot:scaffold109533_cov20-Cyclotella_meneghiniana.AAC.1
MGDPSSSSVDSEVVDLISSFLGPTDSNPASKQVDAAVRDISEIRDSESEVITYYDSVSFRVVIFSKDRPWQLQQLLQSMKLPIENDQEFESGTTLRVNIFIIIHASRHQFRSGYSDALNSLVKRQDGHDRWKIHLYFEGKTLSELDQAPEPDNLMPNSFAQLLKHTLTSKMQLNEKTNSSSQEVV